MEERGGEYRVQQIFSLPYSRKVPTVMSFCPWEEYESMCRRPTDAGIFF